MTQRIGFLGGTFDPPHRGHLYLASHAAGRLGLDRVLLAPAGIQPMKAPDHVAATWQQRLHMVHLAVEEMRVPQVHRRTLPIYVGSDIDAPRPGGQPNYSAETIARLRESQPGAEIYLILGADAFAGLRRWYQPDLLLQQCELVVATRPGQPLPQDGNDLLEFMPVGTRFLGMEEVRQQTAYVFLAGPALVRLYLLDDLAEDIAATDLRNQLAKGRGFEWLPGGEHGRVAEYIRDQGLYGSTPRRV